MELVGKNEGISYVKGMVHQRESTGMQYPSDTNMRGGSRSHREHHAEGDMVGKADGDLVKKAMGGQMLPQSNAMRMPNA
jgi:hypothetical protein